jgi:ABC-type phosphate/phosphonate transport system permease subunit
LISRAGVLADVVAALLIIPVWTYFGTVVALACALALGLLLRFVVHAGRSRGPRR